MKKYSLFFLILVAFACSQEEKSASPSYGEAFFSKNEFNVLWADLSKFSVAASPLELNWEFLGMDSIPGIDRMLPENPKGEPVELPHRLSYANHSFWYKTKVRLEPGFLNVHADDGAQLWVNGKRARRSQLGEFFEISQTGELELVVRVVNNAMAGGLRGLYWMGQTEFLDWRDRIAQAQDSLLSLRKNELLLGEKEENLDSYPILFSSPVLILGTDGSYYLRWISEKPGVATLDFGKGGKVEVKSKDGVFTYEMKEPNLFFTLRQEDSNFGDFIFQIPQEKESLKLAVWGDSQGGWDTFLNFSQAIANEGVDYSIGLGDLVNDGSEEWAYERFLESASHMNTIQIPVPGNHDYDGYYEDLFAKALNSKIFRENELTYGVNYVGPMALMRVDPNTFFPVSLPEGSEQFNWFHSVINSPEWKEKPWKIIALHQPPYSQGWPGYQGEQSIRNLLGPYFHQGLIDVVMAGHTHDYERLNQEFSGNNVQFFIFGGAGGGLEPKGEDSPEPQMDELIKEHHVGILNLNSTELKLSVMGKNGEILDSYSLSKSQ
jgi:predicted phosphodiesterase